MKEANKVKSTIRKNEFHIKKKFGQNFLTDENILRKISNVANIDENTLVIEIGPGLGSLTEFLLEKAGHLLAYEIDNDLIPILNKTFIGSNFTLINDDILARNIDEDINHLDFKYDKVTVVANLPYYITTPILMKCIEDSKYINEMVVMMQLEVANRITSKPSKKDYNSLSIAIQYKTVAKLAFKVPRTVFVPAPNVDSAIVYLRTKEDNTVKPINEKYFYQIVRSSFVQRRKKLSNNLNSVFGYDKTKVEDLLESLGYSRTVRAESLNVEDFIMLSDKLIDFKA
ncbi:hypothetical protein CI105_01335 [Candidatus Izimaplasma bacterium ZiA1]|uniref:16S rRNA (adenine(1518)-N(6)/adenine(1519)-N(6))- dimethyltransferase RsmA n=1 Tax=Candidatus Izimoplasma sp. ZiA1 TaxID=2024899 RepID=UPI000BAA3E3B|nr:hypothetical protein CI105_01335 [Candidatus Izimaplasma bacterium ZiA1]